MITATTVEQVKKEIRKWKQEGLSIGLVPTMGALHEGHASLVRAAASECDRVIVSVFVNPTQFGPGEDIDVYPRDFANDRKVLEANNCSLVFHPSPEEMYPEGYGTYVNLENQMTAQLCGRTRPGHFRGVCTVVSKLFHIAEPDRAYFGQKDAQQLAVIRRMVRDMNFDIKIVGCPIIREEDGLARSSRNTYLNSEERKAALVLSRSIRAGQKMAEEALKNGDSVISAERLLAEMNAVLAGEPMAVVDYVEAVDGNTLESKKELVPGDLVAMAVYIGKTRLIDNFTV